MRTFKKTFQRSLNIVEELKRQQSREYDAILVDKIRRTANSLRKYYEHQCNGCTRERLSGETWSSYDQAREEQMRWVDKQVRTYQARIAKLCGELELHYYHQTDPRGCAVYVSNNPIDDSSYSMTSIAIY